MLMEIVFCLQHVNAHMRVAYFYRDRQLILLINVSNGKYKIKLKNTINNFPIIVLVKKAALNVNLFLVSNSVSFLTGHHSVSVQLHVMVHNLVIEPYKELTVIELTLKLKCDHVVEQLQVIKKVVQHVNV